MDDARFFEYLNRLRAASRGRTTPDLLLHALHHLYLHAQNTPLEELDSHLKEGTLALAVVCTRFKEGTATLTTDTEAES